MNVKIEEIDGKYVVTLEGEMDTVAATEAENTTFPSTIFRPFASAESS